MYGALWRRLPGPAPLKVLWSLLLVACAVLVLFTVVFPWAEPRLPFTEVTVEDSGVTSDEPPASPEVGPVG